MARKRHEIFTAADQHNIADAHRALSDAAIKIGKLEKCGYDCNDLRGLHQALTRELTTLIAEFLAPEGTERMNEGQS